MKMYPMSFFESGESNGCISLKALFNNTSLDIDAIEFQLSIENPIFAACRGGWPGALRRKSDNTKLLIARDYINNICETDISSVDGVQRNPVWTNMILRSYARNISGKMFGFDTAENFDYPYLSRSITEFWRRWHISLGAWFREYLYIPLGGNRKGKIRTYVNLGIVFLFTGLWHGADMAFILWGLFHGFFTIIERLGLAKWLKKSRVIAVIYTFVIVNFGWVLFRAAEIRLGLKMISRMILPFRHAAIAATSIWQYMNPKTLFMIFIAVIGMGVLKTLVPERFREKWNGSVPEAVYIVFILLISMASIASSTYNPFIYFQF